MQRFTRRSERTEAESCLRRLGQLQTLTGRASCPNHLRGLEGSAAALYFRSLGGLLEGGGRRLRGVQPPATAHAVQCPTRVWLWGALECAAAAGGAAGADSSQRCAAYGTPRHAALVSDLIEPLRTFLVDPFHGQLIRTGQLVAVACAWMSLTT
jgi:CRISPR-associated protein Cas1